MSAAREGKFCVYSHAAVWGEGSAFGRDLARVREAKAQTGAGHGHKLTLPAAAKRVGAGPRKVLLSARRSK